MSNFFKVGQSYQNRHGEYKVIELNPPKMRIRYLNGHEIETTIDLQARIWENMQIEQAHKAVESARATPARKRRTTARRNRFAGLVDTDFQTGVTGTSWRAKAGLGGLLAEQLSNVSGQTFESKTVYRRAEVYVVQPDHYSKDESVRTAKFFFRLDEENAKFGLYVEKNDGSMDDSWDWLRLRETLSLDLVNRKKIEQAMIRHNLRCEVVSWPSDGEALLNALVESSEQGLLLKREPEDTGKVTSWPDFVAQLDEVPAEHWCDLSFCADMDKDEVIKAGVDIAESVVAAWEDLLPLYDAIVWPRT